MEQNKLNTGTLDYTELKARYLPWVRSLILRQNGNPDMAEDLFHDAWIVWLEKEKPNLESAQASTYFLGIVKFKWYQHLRNTGRFRKALDVIVLDVEVNPYSEEVEEHYDKLDTVFKRMKSACQAIIFGVFWLGRPMSEIQASLNHKSRQSTFTAKHRCLQELKQEMGK